MGYNRLYGLLDDSVTALAEMLKTGNERTKLELINSVLNRLERSQAVEFDERLDIIEGRLKAKTHEFVLPTFDEEEEE